MKRNLFVVGVLMVTVLIAGAGCGSRDGEATGDGARMDAFSKTPEGVVQGLMYAYVSRNDSLYSELLAGDFRYHFEPPGADSTEFLGWGKEEDLVATSNLFHTAEVDSLALELNVQSPRAASPKMGKEWMVIPVSGGELRVHVHEKEPMRVTLNRQEIYVRKVPGVGDRWEVIAWYDYPEPES